MSITRGHCQCGAIEYEFEGEPKWVMHCHCTNCRRAVSSAVATYVGVRLQQFRYLKGDPAIYESSPGVKRYFCPTCGSPMAFAGARWPGEVHLFHGTLADPAQWPPTGHAYVTEQLPWFETNDHLPRYEVTASRSAKPVRSGPRSYQQWRLSAEPSRAMELAWGPDGICGPLALKNSCPPSGRV